MKKIKIKLNGKIVTVNDGVTIMQAAASKGISIPGLCGHPDFPAKANCRVCVVEISGCDKLATSCSTKVASGMEINTETERVRKARNLNLELIYSEHIEKCANCIWRFECKLLKTAEKYKILITTFRDRKISRKIHKFKNAVEIDGTQCIDCRNCIDTCSSLQDINYLELRGKGVDQEVVPVKKKGAGCILCGQCALHCPVSAAQEQSHWEVVEAVIKKKEKTGKILVVQISPSVLASLGEDFNDVGKKNTEENIVAGLRAVGFDYVFNTGFSADLAAIKIAEEFLNTLESGMFAGKKKKKIKKKLPLITSACSGWTRYVDIYRKDLKSHLSTVRSPHMIGGGLIKTYWAEQARVKAKDIIVVSIIPCTAKKYEASLRNTKIKSSWPVDYVLTAREISFMFKKKNINYLKLKKSKFDDPLSGHTGAGTIFGASGGTIEAVLRTAYVLANQNSKSKTTRPRVDFKKVRGFDGMREMTIKIAGNSIRIAIVNGISNVRPVLEKLSEYDLVEVMACPGGCVGGGGQPIPTIQALREKRTLAIYNRDKSKKQRISIDNKQALKILNRITKNRNLEKEIFYN